MYSLSDDYVVELLTINFVCDVSVVSSSLFSHFINLTW